MFDSGWYGKEKLDAEESWWKAYETYLKLQLL